MIDEKAKKRMITDIKVLVQLPSCPVSVRCTSSIPVTPAVLQSFEKSTIIAEAVQTKSVSTKTPIA